MKTQVLLLAGCIALATVVRGQNDQAPVNPAQAAPANPAPAAPTNAAPAAPTNAPAVIATPDVIATAVLPAANMATNTASADAAMRPSATNELVPLIVIDDVPLIDAVKNLARQAGLNYLPDPRLATVTNQPNVTMRLENVTAHDALMAVLETYNLQIVNDPRIKVSRITVKDPAAAEPLFSKIVQLKYTQPSNVLEIVRSTLKPPGRVMGDPRTSQLIVVATEKEFPAIDELVARLDTPTRQVLIEAQLWETAKNPKTVKGIDWSGTFQNQHVVWGNGHITSGETITSRPGTPRTVPTPGGGSTTFTPKSSTSEETTYSPVGGGITLDSVKGFHPATAFLSADGLSAVISFFNTDNDSEVVATPRAVTLDNQQATLSVTRAFPIFQITPGSANSPAGASVTYTNLGTILQVTPHIAANSNISLSVTPEVSNIAGKDVQTVNGFQNTANIYEIRRMETHVMIPSSYTLVLGGLISDTTVNTESKVPILGDIPFLGRAFGKTEKSRDKGNLIVFITPTIVGDYDYQLASSDFMQTRMPHRAEPKENFMDSAKPFDWTKPKENTVVEDPKPIGAPMPADATVK